MSQKILQIAMFTATQLANAVHQVNAHLPIKIEVSQVWDELVYVVSRTDCDRCSLPMKCGETTVAQLTNAVTQLFYI